MMYSTTQRVSSLFHASTLLVTSLMPLLTICSLCPKNSQDGSFMLDHDYSTRQLARLQEDTQLLCKPITNFTSIEWYKDNKPLPRGNHYVIDPDDYRLTLKNVAVTDRGNYTCVVTNDEGFCTSRTIFLNPYKSNEEAPNLVSYPECVDKVADVGDNVTFICKFFTAGAAVSLSWYKRNETAQRILNVTDDEDEVLTYVFWLHFLPEFKGSTFTHNYCKDRDGFSSSQYLYTCFTITNVTEAAYGSYILQALQPGRHKNIYIRNLSPRAIADFIFEPPTPNNYVVPVVILALMIVLTAVTWKAVGIDMKLYYKERWQNPEQSDASKVYHTYICCANVDFDCWFAQQLKSRLEQEGYNVWLPEIDSIPGNDSLKEIIDALQTSCRVIILLSPECVQSRYQAFEMNISIEEISAYREHMIPLVIRDISGLTYDPILKHLLKKCHVLRCSEDKLVYNNCVAQSELDNECKQLTVMRENSNEEMNICLPRRFYKKLLLALPPRPK